MTAHYIEHLAPQDLLAALADRQWPGGGARPPVTRSATSQGAPVPAATVASGLAVLTGDEPLTGARPRRGRQANVGVTKTEMLRLMATNGGRATQRQLSQALRISLTANHIHCRELAAAGLIVRSGTAGLPPSNAWALPPLQASFEMQPHVKVGQTARRGHGPQRALDALIAAGGRISQAQAAGVLGVTPNTVAKHFQLLEARPGAARRPRQADQQPGLSGVGAPRPPALDGGRSDVEAAAHVEQHSPRAHIAERGSAESSCRASAPRNSTAQRCPPVTAHVHSRTSQRVCSPIVTISVIRRWARQRAR
jgi:hypothetical protein